MADISGYQEAVERIRDTIGDDSVYFGWDHRDLDRIRGEARCAIFVPRSGTHEQPATTGDVEIEEGFVAIPMYYAAFDVDAHIRGESWDVTYLLWQNILNAAREVFSGESRIQPGAFEFVTQSRDNASHRTLGAQYVVQEFGWRVPLYKGLVRLPPCGHPVKEFIEKRVLVPLKTFGVEGEYVDYAEMPPGPPPNVLPEPPGDDDDDEDP